MPMQNQANTKLSLRFVLTAFILGAFIGTTGDFVHVITNTDGYPPNGPAPFLPLLPVNMPVWVPFLFGTAVMLMAGFHRLSSAKYTPRMGDNKDYAYAAPVLFLILYALTGFITAGTGGLQDVWIAVVAIALWWVMDRTLWGAGFAIINALLGTAFEICLVHINGFYYYPEHSNLFGVPSWLPWLYVAASICISVLVRQMK